MKHRFAVALSALASLYMLGALTSHRTATAAAQGPNTSTTDTWAVPRTSWGHPDLQGVWTTDVEINVPLERPVELGEKAVLTEAEYKERLEMLARRAREAAARRPARESTGAGPEHWYERGGSLRTSLVIDPPNGRIPPYTPEAEKRVPPRGTELGFVGGSFGNGPYDGPEDMALTDRCITRGLPQTWFPSQYNNGFQIVQSPEHVTVYYERLHEARVIPIDGRPHLDPTVRQWLGDSRGHWEGDTLVVDVTNFSDRMTTFRKSGSTLHLIERYTRVGPDAVRVEVTIDDPTTWTRRWTFAVTGKKDPNYWQIFEYACHEGNYGMRNMLSGARAAESAAANPTKKTLEGGK